MLKQFCLVIVLLVSADVQLSADEPSADQAAREKAFSEMLSNTTMTGSFTVDKKTDTPPKPESYSIKSVKKLTGNLWTFMTHIKYGKTDTTLPITVPVVWAGETPMVSLTNQSLPGLGDAFSARVVFHDGRYAGTWQHGKVGGHMFGAFKKTSTADSQKD